MLSGLNKLKALIIRKDRYDQKQFNALRNNFLKHLTYEVERLNREADWADFNYTELEAEVDPIEDLRTNTYSNHTTIIIQTICNTVKLRRRTPQQSCGA
jgi:hypothetical protein